MKLDENNILIYDIDKLWSILGYLKDSGYPISDDNYNLIKNGFKIKFPIHYLIEEWYNLYPSTKRVSIQGYGKFKMDDFMEEVDKRKALLRTVIMENIEDDDYLKGRV